jgi:hypothetical protein
VLQHEVVGVFLTKYKENTMLEPMRQGADIWGGHNNAQVFN